MASEWPVKRQSGLKRESIQILATRSRPYILATGADLAIVTAHPFDISALRTQLAIKKVPELLSPVYRLVLEPDVEAQALALRRGQTLAVAMQLGEAGLPAREADPARDNFPCNYCPWKSKCVADGSQFGLMFPAIPQDMKVKPEFEVA